MHDTIIHSKYVITPGGVRAATIVIKNGLIADIVYGKLENAMDVGESFLMPGVIDPHVHINEPGRTDWEGFDTATKSALAGGITTLVDMPLNSSPVTTTAKAFDEKLSAAKGKLHVNCGFWGGVIRGNKNDIEPLIEKGVPGFKAFLVHSGIDEFPNVSEADLRQVMPLIARHDLPLLVHCELPGPQNELKKGNEDSYQTYLVSRPREWEDQAIGLMIRLSDEFNCRVHIVHLSSSNSIEQIREAKKSGVRITVETCPHYLFFSAEEIGDGRTEFKCAPPIREKENNEKLWEALKDGLIDFIATDHSPCPPEMKQKNTGSFMKAWGGIASLQFSLPIVWTAARKKNIPPGKIAEWLCEKPALLPGLNKKGKIEIGFDADLVVWNPEKTFTVTEEIIHHKHKLTPYLHQQLFGVVEQTWLAGEKVYDDGKFLHLNQGRPVTGNQK